MAHSTTPELSKVHEENLIQIATAFRHFQAYLFPAFFQDRKIDGDRIICNRPATSLVAHLLLPFSNRIISRQSLNYLTLSSLLAHLLLPFGRAKLSQTGSYAKREPLHTLTPPRAGSLQANMSPNTFITSSATAKNIKRKSSLNITPTKLKRTRQDVSNPSNQLTLVSDFDLVLDGVNNLKKRVKDLERVVHEDKTRIAELQCDVEDLKSAQISKDNADAQFRADSAEDANGRIELLMANLVIDLAKYAARSLHQDHLCIGHSTHALEQFASRIPEIELGKAGIPTKHWDLLRKMPKYTAARTQAAHETSGDLARLLLRPSSTTSYQRFKDLFPILYGQPIEKLAEMRRTEWAELYQ